LTRVWRICKQRYDAFGGQGGRLVGGRWNHPGAAVVYTSATLSLAALELLVQLDLDDVPGDMVAISADIPDSVRRSVLAIDAPERDWRRYPSPSDLCNVGTRWATSMDTAVLVVPSTIIPSERNYLLNPAHPAFREIHVQPPEPFVLRPSGRP
jgi:RES domain-containing protein